MRNVRRTLSAYILPTIFLAIIEVSLSWSSLSSQRTVRPQFRHQETLCHSIHQHTQSHTPSWSLSAITSNTAAGYNDSTATSLNSGHTWSDDEFQQWIYDQLVHEAGQVLYETYGDSMFVQLSRCITRWRQRYQLGEDALVWKRLFKRDRVVKEVIESIPVIDAIDAWMASRHRDEKVTIIDLCSGKGYLSMLLSEYLQPEKVTKLILIDKAWPMCFAEPKPHHMNWDHIYGSYTTHDDKEETYFTTWPIPLHTSKQDLKQKSTFRQLKKRIAKAGPTFILGVHLCGTLSIQAVSLFHTLDSVEGLILKPCCLPGMVYERSQDNFSIGKYAFPTKEVCSPGKWKKKEWEGPPLWHLEKKFDSWCYHLHQGMQV
jgi:hypothetical protein